LLYPKKFGVIVIGAGHAGCEAAFVAARCGVDTLLVTDNIETIGQLSCNPAIGGIGKGHLVKEIDAMGGIMGRAADLACIHFRTLNQRKGPAVQATRVQVDRNVYKQTVRNILEAQKNLYIFQSSVEDLIINKEKVCGIKTQIDVRIKADAVVLTSGTFLNGKIHVGLKNYTGGRAGEKASVLLSDNIKSYGLTPNRLKTGTPARIAGFSIDFTKLQTQESQKNFTPFSFFHKTLNPLPHKSCYITRTNNKTHKIIQDSLKKSPLYSGVITSAGPRYCPSIEDKVVRFSNRDSHQIFVEPEGLNTDEYYPNGISTSLSFDVQLKLIHSIVGFENAFVTRAGYAIEYDYFDPQNLKYSLETRAITNLYFAGQINGTTGYEEAAAQGLIAGLNAARTVQKKNAFIATRDNSYMGVMIDDLISVGLSEPYRMFTSRSEYRLSLREDNADERLMPVSYKMRIIKDKIWQKYQRKQELIAKLEDALKKTKITNRNIKKLKKSAFANVALKQPDININDVMPFIGIGEVVNDAVKKQVQTKIKYDGYLKRQQKQIKKYQRQRTVKIPFSFNYKKITGLSNELKEKLQKQKPGDISQALQIHGMTPAAIAILLVALKKYG
jgi:tRNA uridine 5-carboxymethylaminomethyl modification enzyme